VLREQLGFTQGWRVADIGSGTGIWSALLLEHGAAVFGVEPNAEMRAAAETALAEWPGFRSVEGSAELTTLADQSVDLVTAAQAFHWFDRERARVEFVRILRPPARLALIWNRRITAGTPFLVAYETLLEQHGTDYQQVRHDHLREDTIAAFFNGPYHRTRLPNHQLVGWPGLRGRVLSSSYVPPAGDPRCIPMLRALEQIFAEHQTDGQVRLEYDTEVYAGELR
jgi:SAM-dependent methyltransferase